MDAPAAKNSAVSAIMPAWYDERWAASTGRLRAREDLEVEHHHELPLVCVYPREPARDLVGAELGRLALVRRSHPEDLGHVVDREAEPRPARLDQDPFAAPRGPLRGQPEAPPQVHHRDDPTAVIRHPEDDRRRVRHRDQQPRHPHR